MAAKLREVLTDSVNGWIRISANPGAYIREMFVLEHGVECYAQPLPKGIRRGWPKQCFANARNLVKRRKSLTYCEGFVLVPRIEFFPIHHAWAIDKDRRVVDNTLVDPEVCGYIGIPVSADELREVKGDSILLMPKTDLMNVDYMVARSAAIRHVLTEWRTNRNR
jgi:hypothetical protein